MINIDDDGEDDLLLTIMQHSALVVEGILVTVADIKSSNEALATPSAVKSCK